MKIVPKTEPIEPDVRNDEAGAGHFGAPRGERTHRGIDYLSSTGDDVLAPVDGQVTHIGFPYDTGPNERVYRYVQITAADGLNHRVFYVDPCVYMGQRVVQDLTCIGQTDDITKRFADRGHPLDKMENHIHLEVKRGSEYLDPDNVSNH